MGVQVELVESFQVFSVSSLLCNVLQECQTGSVEPAVKIFTRAVEQKEPKKKKKLWHDVREIHKIVRGGEDR